MRPKTGLTSFETRLTPLLTMRAGYSFGNFAFNA